MVATDRNGIFIGAGANWTEIGIAALLALVWYLLNRKTTPHVVVEKDKPVDKDGQNHNNGGGLRVIDHKKASGL